MLENWLQPLIQWLGVGSLTTLLLLALVVIALIRLIKGD